MKNFLIVLGLVFFVGAVGIYMLFLRPVSTQYSNDHYSSDVDVVDNSQNINNDEQDESEKEDEEDFDETQTILGQSVEGRNIIAYHYGTGDKELLFVGGIHGGYSGNTTELMNEFIKSLDSQDYEVPEDMKITVIPVLNPDGLELSGQGDSARFNANNVDLNRNFDCNWESESLWRNQKVSGGAEVFSEPESIAVRDYVLDNNIEATVVYYSAAGGVYASSCSGDVDLSTKNLTDTYANASGYAAYQEFDYYTITGDMVNWLAKMDIPAISVLLSDHKNIEWSKNQAGIEAVIEYYSE